jgi:hypothetical protein
MRYGRDSSSNERAQMSQRAWWIVRYWRRGWRVLLLAFLAGLGVSFADYAFGIAKAYYMQSRDSVLPIALVMAAVVIGVLLVPAWAYFAFVVVFGEASWPTKKKRPTSTPEEERDVVE